MDMYKDIYDRLGKVEQRQDDIECRLTKVETKTDKTYDVITELKISFERNECKMEALSDTVDKLCNKFDEYAERGKFDFVSWIKNVAIPAILVAGITGTSVFLMLK